jgi:hypothetical protein
VTVIPAPTGLPSPSAVASPDVLPSVVASPVELSPEPSPSPVAVPAQEKRDTGSRLNRLVQLLLGGAVLLGLAGGTGLYLTRSH